MSKPSTSDNSKNTTEAPLPGEVAVSSSTEITVGIDISVIKVPPRNWQLSVNNVIYGDFLERSRAMQIMNYTCAILSDLMLKKVIPDLVIMQNFELVDGRFMMRAYTDEQHPENIPEPDVPDIVVINDGSGA